MGYAIRIRRAENKPPITGDEWAAVVRADAALVPAPDDSVESCAWREDETCVFVLVRGEVTIDDATEGWEQIIGQVAARLDAIAVGDDGERYLPDGTVVDAPARPTVKHLPDGVGFALGCLAVVGVFAWFGLAIWFLGRLRIGLWGALIGLAVMGLSRLRWRETLVREGLLAFGGATALAGAVAALYALISGLRPG